MSRSVAKMYVSIEIQNDGKQPFVDLCAKITQESTAYLGPRMSKCFVHKRIVSATSVQLKFLVCFPSNKFPNSIEKALNTQIESERAGIPTETIRGCVTIKVWHEERPDAPGMPKRVLPDDVAWLELHTSIANEVRNCPRAEPSVSKSRSASLSDVTESGSSWSTVRPMDAHTRKVAPIFLGRQQAIKDAAAAKSAASSKKKVEPGLYYNPKDGKSFIRHRNGLETPHDM